MDSNNKEISKYITEDDIKKIVENCGYEYKDVTFKYYIENASDKMLGFLADYWRLQIRVTSDLKEKMHCFFIKAVSRSNEAKAAMVKELNLYEKEAFFYTDIKKKLELKRLRPWSPALIATIDDALVFEDLAASEYKSRNKFKRFDMAHTLQALNTLSRFHAASIICEENESELLQRPFRFNNEYKKIFVEKGYLKTSSWYLQCMNGALEAIRTFSKYVGNENVMCKIEREWENIWFSALDLCAFSTKHRNVICHRDLWNNNIMFHYKRVLDHMEPDDCVLVDFQAMLCIPPACDVMTLLYCNLEPKFRENNMILFLHYYYEELSRNLSNHGIKIAKILNKEDFLKLAEEYRKWGLIVCACLIPQFWVDDELTTNIFTNSDQFKKILSENKGEFIKKMIQVNQDYKEKVMEIFEEIIERYCIPDSA